jgi:Holliday junction DNA helicase RuvB
LTNLEPRDVLFIDEIHRLAPGGRGNPLPGDGGFCLDLVIGEGPSARTVRIDLPPFTLVGATTRARPAGDTAAGSFRRAGASGILRYGGARRHCRARGGASWVCPCRTMARTEIARRARGTPRVAGRLLRRVRDFIEADGVATIDAADRRQGAETAGGRRIGLDSLDRRYLDADRAQFRRRACGPRDARRRRCRSRATPSRTCIEPFLIQQGFLQRTPRGRVLTARAWGHMGLNAPKDLAATQASLFEDE